jgi:hypothetical protein
LPSDYVLYQNYPNPFNASTIIKYSLKYKSNILVILYDILGKKIKIMVNETKKSGTYSIKFQNSELSSGIYFYSLFANGILINSKKLIIIK